ncbi:helix-turn-helix domain-containing protein [Solibacillus isronensis]|uniref:helix-turn-helix domain-containing protein n=1 Tax=Solibacillus isronensis TaxID=412383 RepID=UPI0007FB1DC7|nr:MULTISPECIES: helix-turn-helix transcriptional regulator [Solibacillus]OBW54715.1 hypothetical protein A9986_13920 [Solibacillus silvestris]
MLPTTEESVSTLGDWLKLNRKMNNVSQKELSKASKLSQSLISQIEQGVVHDISIVTLFRLLNYFRADINDVAAFINSSTIEYEELNNV